MKFPKSLHPEGWLEQLEGGTPREAGPAHSPRLKPRAGQPGPGAKVGRDTPLFDAPAPEPARAASLPGQPSAGAMPGAAATPRDGISPWWVGAGAGLALVALAVSMSRNLSSVDLPGARPTLTAQAQPEVNKSTSVEDTVLAAAPAAAGLTRGGDVAPPSPAVAPAAPPAQAVAAAPQAKGAKRLAATVAEPPAAPAPQVAKTAKTAEPTGERTEALAAATLPLAMPLESARPESPVSEDSPPARPPQVLAEAEDSGITAQVREALSADAVLASAPIAVSTAHGVVRLEGFVPDAQARERATVVAAATSGVKAVDNRLVLPPVASLGGGHPSGA